MKMSPGGSLAASHRLLWQGGATRGKEAVTATGFPELDHVLPADGWPGRALIEITVPYWGMGELRLLLPAMLRLNQQKRRIVWIAPPYLPYAPALINAGLNLDYVMVVDARADNISWAMERVLHTEACGMVLAWPRHLSALEARRLQLAAEAGGTTGIILHTADAKWQATSAALRLHIQAAADGIVVKIVKARGTSQRPQVLIDMCS